MVAAAGQNHLRFAAGIIDSASVVLLGLFRKRVRGWQELLKGESDPSGGSA
jgi:hypothetical protein